MQYFARLGPCASPLFVSGTWDEEIFVVESVTPGEPHHPAVELVGYLTDEMLEHLSLQAGAAATAHQRQRQEDHAAEEYEAWAA